jgi:ribosomal protein S18 acetylase RimI-like enzyme
MTRTLIQESDRPEVAEFIERHWGSTKIMSGGRAYYPHELEGLIERRDEQIVGLLTMHVVSDSLEVLTLNSTLEGQRIGSSLMLAAIDDARKRGLNRIWLTTTNDNLRAIGFYQRLGFRIVAVHVDAVDEARKVKPEIPEIGRQGIPIHDEIVLELTIQPFCDAAD